MFNDAQTPADNPGNVDSMSDEHGEPVPDTHADSKAASDTSRRPYRQPPALLAGVATMVVVLLVALVLATFARGSILQKSATAGDNSTVTTTADGMSTTTDAPTTAAASTTTDVPTSTVGSTGGAGDTGGATGTPPGYVPLQVTGLTLTVDQSSVNGTCQDNILFVFTLTVSIVPGSGGGWVDYTVVPSDSAIGQNSSGVLFGSNDTSETTTFGETMPAQYGDGTPHWVQVQITSPNALSSQQVSFEATCLRQVTGATASVTPNVWNAPCARTQAFTFKFTITLTPGPPVSVTFARNTSGGFGEWYPPTQTFNVTGDVLTYSGPGTLYSPSSGGGNGTYWQSIAVTAPNSVTSNRASITETC